MMDFSKANFNVVLKDIPIIASYLSNFLIQNLLEKKKNFRK